MKILKAGTPEKLKVYRGTCPKCGCEAEFDDTERSILIHCPAIVCPTVRCMEWIKGVECPSSP